MKSPLDHPEASALFSELLVSLTAESDRGAILVGTAHVDNCLRSLLEAVLPTDLGKPERGELLRYPGPLSALAARTQVTYGLRLVPRSIYDSVNALRDMRNDVAHRPEAFALRTQEDRIRQVYAAMGPDFPNGLRGLALEMMLDYKTHVLIEAAREVAQRDPDLGLLIETKEQAANFIRETPEVLEAMRDEVLRWELAIGIAAICGVIIQYREEAKTILGAGGTLGRVVGSIRNAVKSKADGGE
jgi:hypothetical protein